MGKPLPDARGYASSGLLTGVPCPSVRAGRTFKLRQQVSSRATSHRSSPDCQGPETGQYPQNHQRAQDEQAIVKTAGRSLDPANHGGAEEAAQLTQAADDGNPPAAPTPDR